MELTERVEKFFSVYGHALARYDAEASVAMWGRPGLVLSDDFAAVMDDPAATAEAMASSFPLYQELGLSRVTPTDIAVQPLTEKLVQVRLTWRFDESDGSPLTTGDYLYVLRDDEQELRVYVAIGFDEDERIAELAERKGVDLSKFGGPQ